MTGPEPPRQRSLHRLAAILYVPSAAAVAINLFLLSLLGPTIGLPVLAPVIAVALGAVLGVPVTYWAAVRVNRLIDEAER